MSAGQTAAARPWDMSNMILKLADGDKMFVFEHNDKSHRNRINLTVVSSVNGGITFQCFIQSKLKENCVTSLL